MKKSEPDPQGKSPGRRALESTASLLVRVRRGDDGARNQLIGRYLPAFQRWAHGRLPSYARDLAETDDLVQVTLMSALDHIEGFEPRREGAFLAYLRQILMNKVRDEIRRVGRRPRKETVPEDLAGDVPSPLDQAISEETLEAYERSLAGLPVKVREAVFLRIEFGLTYEQIAEAVESPSANATRMMISRGLVRMAEAMNGAQNGTG